ncbi:AraC family transcriptional regulator [Polyangium sp. y55x31]|uniref:helix-turn-helix domain-containing protein n=1 Tax=Polyangium sp. y55x31 TaxID=3042688 RepID=UPI002482267A|nr:AraC family transcriptional regulator [Polyangium sp. y55x31]MDI1480341.1 AraC family transcriptional regulator [Polyangium sp. y55x31]
MGHGSAQALEGKARRRSRDDGPRIERWRPEGIDGLSMFRVEGVSRPLSSYAEHYGVAVVLEGAFDGWYRGAVRTLTAGSLKLKEPGEVHREVRVHAPFTLQGAAFASDMVEEAARTLGIPRPVRFVPVEPGRAPRATALAMAMHEALAARGPATLELTALVTETLTEVLATCTERGEVRVHARAPRAVRLARDYLRANVSEPITLDALAAHAGADKFHLIRAFRAELGIPPYEYLTHLRVARAAELLAAGMTGAEAAHAVGLFDESQLHRHFRRILGTTPGKFARAMRRQDRPSGASASRLACRA